MDMSPPDWVILLAVAATTVVTTLMLPPRWGWKALPAVAAIVLAILLAATGCMFLVIGFLRSGRLPNPFRIPPLGTDHCRIRDNGPGTSLASEEPL